MANDKRVGAQDFEAFKEFDTFTSIHTGLMKSKAWQDLSASQRGLYLEIKSEYRRKVERGKIISENHGSIIFPKARYYPLYHGNYRAWNADRQALIEHGFITMKCNRHIRRPNVYTLSSSWKNWKPEGKHLNENEQH